MRVSAIVNLLNALGCETKVMKTHVAIRFDVDSPHLDSVRKFIYEFCREERHQGNRVEWFSENRASGEIHFE